MFLTSIRQDTCKGVVTTYLFKKNCHFANKVPKYVSILVDIVNGYRVDSWK